MTLNGAAVPWPGAIRAHSDPGLSTVIGERRLCSDGSALPVSFLEAEALSLAEWAFARDRPLVLCPPDPLAPVSALIAAAVHIADMTDWYRKSGQYLGSSKHVAVVTNDYHARGLYRDLGVRSPKSMGVAPLRQVVPAATLGKDGVIRVLGADPAGGWSTIFVSSVASLRSLPDIDLVVVTLPARDVEDLLTGGVPVVVVANDPADALLARVADRVPVFAWDATDLDRAARRGDLPPRLAFRAAGSRCDVIAVPAHSVCENAALFWQDIGPLVHSGDRSSVAQELAREALSLFHDLSGLALPIEMYEQLTAPIRVRLDAVDAASRLTRGQTRDLYLPMVATELRDLSKALGPEPPKREALLRTLRELKYDGAEVLLVARTADLARLHRSDLAGQGALSEIRVASLGALADERPADVAILTGMAPTWGRWVYRSGIASTVRVLAYTPEGPVESVAKGYDEVDLVRHTVSLQQAREVWFSRPCAKDKVWSGLSGDIRLVHDDGSRAPTADTGRVTVTTQAPPDVPPGLWEGDGWFASIAPEGRDPGGGRDRDGLARSGAPVVEAVTVTFEDGRWTLMDLLGTVTLFKPVSGTAEPASPVKTLRPGDRIILFDGDSRKDLLAKVIEVAVEVPALAVAAGWVAHWRRILSAAYRRFGTYSAFAEALRNLGCAVQTQTVRLWVIGVTIGPDDDEDVRRVGIVMDDSALRDHHDEVCRGVRSLRGAHVRLGQRLSAVAMRVGSAAAAGVLAEDEVVDARSGLTVADFRESIDVLTVRSVEPAGEVPYLLIGCLNDEEMEEGHDG